MRKLILVWAGRLREQGGEGPQTGRRGRSHARRLRAARLYHLHVPVRPAEGLHGQRHLILTTHARTKFYQNIPVNLGEALRQIGGYLFGVQHHERAQRVTHSLEALDEGLGRR